ncbi:MAG: hypothetical protein AAGI09_06950 [Pseudomonadota bacterium]
MQPGRFAGRFGGGNQGGDAAPAQAAPAPEAPAASKAPAGGWTNWKTDAAKDD